VLNLLRLTPTRCSAPGGKNIYFPPHFKMWTLSPKKVGPPPTILLFSTIVGDVSCIKMPQHLCPLSVIRKKPHSWGAPKFLGFTRGKNVPPMVAQGPFQGTPNFYKKWVFQWGSPQKKGFFLTKRNNRVKVLLLVCPQKVLCNTILPLQTTIISVAPHKKELYSPPC